MANIVALQWRESGIADSLAFVSRPFADLSRAFNVDSDGDEPYDSGNVADYRITPTEEGNTGRYLISLPANTPVGFREITAYEMAGSDLAESDMPNVIGVGVVYWDGESVQADGPAALTDEYDAAKTAASQLSVNAISTTLGTAGDGLTGIPKTGYKLASDGLDSITATTPTGVATTFTQKVNQLWARFFGRVTKDSDEIKTYRADGTTVATTQAYTSAGDDDDVGAAS